MKSKLTLVLILALVSVIGEAEAGTVASAPPYSSTDAFPNWWGDCTHEPQTETSATTAGNVVMQLEYRDSCDLENEEAVVYGSAHLLKNSNASVSDGESLTATIRYRVNEVGGTLEYGSGRHAFSIGFDLSDQEDAYSMTCDGDGNCSSQVFLKGSCILLEAGSCSPSGSLAVGTYDYSFAFTVACNGPSSCNLNKLRTFINAEFEYYAGWSKGTTSFSVDVLSLKYEDASSPPPPPPPPPAKKLYGIGDSIAAGYGYGSDGNASAYPSQVLNHWGVPRGYIGDNYAVSGSTSDDVRTKQLPRILSEDPNIVLLTVGANDVQFGQCAKAYLLPGENNPCEGTAFTSALTTLESNLRRIFSTLRSARVVVTEYYNPLPAPSGFFDDVCNIFYVTAILKASTGDSQVPFLPALRELARKEQADAWANADKVVQALNGTIRATAAAYSNVSVAEVDSVFQGHDICRGGNTAWVFGPEGSADLNFFGGTEHFTYSMPFSCPYPPSGDPRFDKVTERYEIHLSINCAPHPTFEGQVALRKAVIATLG